MRGVGCGSGSVRWKRAGLNGNCAWQPPRCCELAENITTPWNNLELRTLGFLCGAHRHTCDEAETRRVVPSTHGRQPNLPSPLAGSGVKLIASVASVLSLVQIARRKCITVTRRADSFAVGGSQQDENSTTHVLEHSVSGGGVSICVDHPHGGAPLCAGDVAGVMRGTTREARHATDIVSTACLTARFLLRITDEAPPHGTTGCACVRRESQAVRSVSLVRTCTPRWDRLLAVDLARVSVDDSMSAKSNIW